MMAFPGTPGDVHLRDGLMFTLVQAAVAVCLMAVGPTESRIDRDVVQDKDVVKVAAVYLGGLPGEVRLRKLHLVRPDLIPYPISFEAYC